MAKSRTPAEIPARPTVEKEAISRGQCATPRHSHRAQPRSQNELVLTGCVDGAQYRADEAIFCRDGDVDVDVMVFTNEVTVPRAVCLGDL